MRLLQRLTGANAAFTSLRNAAQRGIETELKGKEKNSGKGVWKVNDYKLIQKDRVARVTSKGREGRRSDRSDGWTRCPKLLFFTAGIIGWKVLIK